ncbi:hypothetical protein BJD55_gp079 [Gordonia phage Yvonnetastic]|uniref:Uncharacterized protein n=1 Tax=Gordonia phage Yvonnetastic TaxID=1821566 RepID=A0A142K9A4_9CAUD|nr:hypothetical protein BJD55_gp079 [Gordonia phage Yvonnetastic]AMS02687.1 hypothetical protein SEA_YVONNETASTIC_143 [Gordonia phage Yvonnetastic]
MIVGVLSTIYVVLSILVGVNLVRVSRFHGEGALGQIASFVVGFAHPAFVAYYAVKTLAVLIWTPRPYLEMTQRYPGQLAQTVVFNSNYSEIENYVARQKKDERRRMMRYTQR